MYDLLIIGGGAAGFFTAINAKEKNKNLKIAIVERGKEFLTKVKISGGGRCNVTNSIFDPKLLVKNYPRGEKQLLGPFHSFDCEDTMNWFKKRGVLLKIEDDGRVFPVSDDSQTIVDCFYKLCNDLGIELFLNSAIKSFEFKDNYWTVDTLKQKFESKNLVLTTGSNSKIWEILSALNHKIIEPVPSLFTFNIKDDKRNALMGIAANGQIKILDTKLQSEGPILITHWGLSGPAILKLSAWGARILFEKNYQFRIQVNWTPLSKQAVMSELNENKSSQAKKQIGNTPLFGFPKRLWTYFLDVSEINQQEQWANLPKIKIQILHQNIACMTMNINGKSTFKEEFVTAGGIELNEVNFKNMSSKIIPQLFFAGEILNIDAITGGFNFQNAWTGGWLISECFKS